jgi:hypothetical protein
MSLGESVTYVLEHSPLAAPKLPGEGGSPRGFLVNPFNYPSFYPLSCSSIAVVFTPKKRPFKAFRQITLISPFSQKQPFVTRCAPTALKMNCGKLKAKNSRFFCRHFARKSLGNQAKTHQNVSPKCRNFRGNPRRFLVGQWITKSPAATLNSLPRRSLRAKAGQPTHPSTLGSAIITFHR